MGKILLTGRKQALDFDEVDSLRTPMETDYIREEKRKIEEGKDGWALLFSANSGGSVGNIEQELAEKTAKFGKEIGIDRVRTNRFKRLDRERKANRSRDI